MALMALLLLDFVHSLAASNELGLARIANSRVGRFGPLHVESSFNETLSSLTGDKPLYFTVIMNHNSGVLSSFSTSQFLLASAVESPLVVVALGESARGACESLRGKKIICVKGSHLESEDAGLSSLALEASLELAVAHYSLNAISLDHPVLYIDLSRVQSTKIPSSLISSSSAGSKKSDVSYLTSSRCGKEGDGGGLGQGLAILYALPTPAATRCLYEWVVYIWLKRKKEIDALSFSRVFPDCIAEVDGQASVLTPTSNLCLV